MADRPGVEICDGPRGLEYVWVMPNVSCYVTCPDEHGEGGGASYMSYTHPAGPSGVGSTQIVTTDDSGDEPDSFAAAFQAIRDTIDSVLDPWLDLPDPSAVEGEINNCRSVWIELGGEGATVTVDGSISTVPVGKVASNLEQITLLTQELQGNAADAFRENFVLPLPGTVTNLKAIAAFLSLTAACEQVIMQAAGTEIANAVYLARESFDAIWEERECQWSWIPQVGSLIAGVAATFSKLSLDVTSIFVVFDNVLKLVDQEVSEEDIVTYDDCMAAFIEAVGTLHQNVSAAEEAIRQDILSTERNVRTNPSLHDLSLSSISGGSGAASLEWRHAIVDQIVGHLDSVAEHLGDAQKAIPRISLTSAIRRDGRIGIGDIGPGRQHRDLADLLYSLIGNLKEESALASQHLEQVNNALRDADDVTQVDLHRLTSQVDATPSNNPWLSSPFDPLRYMRNAYWYDKYSQSNDEQ